VSVGDAQARELGERLQPLQARQASINKITIVVTLLLIRINKVGDVEVLKLDAAPQL
jgi:hypothetical protein